MVCARRLVVLGLLTGLISGRVWADNGSTEAKNIAILVPVTQPVIEEIIRGFKHRMNELGYEESTNVNYRVYDATGDPNRFTPIAQGAVAANPDLLIPISTPITQRVVKRTQDRSLPFS